MNVQPDNKKAPGALAGAGGQGGAVIQYGGVTSVKKEDWPELDDYLPAGYASEFTLATARAEVQKVLDALPDLGRGGFRRASDDSIDFDGGRSDLLSREDLALFVLTVACLKNQKPRETIDPGYSSTRCAADVAERIGRVCDCPPADIRDGHIIAAATHLGIGLLRPPGYRLALMAIDRLQENATPVMRTALECSREAWANLYGIDVEHVGEPVYEGTNAWFIEETEWAGKYWMRSSHCGPGYETNPWWPIENGRPPDGPIVPPDEAESDAAMFADIKTEVAAEPAVPTLADDWSSLAAAIDTLNRDFAAVTEGGKFMIFRMVQDPIFERKKLERISPESFRQMYANVQVPVTITEGDKDKIVSKTAAAWWMMDRRRRQYLSGVIFDPSGRSAPDFWNLWQGWPTTPEPGDWSLMRNHIRQVICSGDESHDRYVMGWLARMIQQPGTPGEVALVLRGKKGCGKGIFANFLNQMLGQHGIRISDPKHLVGNFNAHLRDAIFLFADEAFFAADRHQDGILKGLVTEPVIFVEAKGKDGVQCKNMLHIMMASNSNYVVPATDDERRYAVLDVSSARIGDYAYFGAITAQMNAGGLTAMLHDLLEYDISTFNHRLVPQTSALDEQKLMSLDSLDKWWMAVLMRGFILRSRHGFDIFSAWPGFVATQLLVRSYQQYCLERRQSYVKDDSHLGQFMGRLYDPKRPTGFYPIDEVDVIDNAAPKQAVMKERPNGYVLGDLDAARASFAEKLGVTIQWDVADAA